eukprot:sb/3479426/
MTVTLKCVLSQYRISLSEHPKLLTYDYVRGEPISSKVNRICERFRINSATPNVHALLSHALEARMKHLVEKLVSANHHRLDLRLGQTVELSMSNNSVREILVILQLVNLEVMLRRHEREKAIIMKEAKSRSEGNPPEAKAKIKNVTLEEEPVVGQVETVGGALAAIGNRKRNKNLDMPGGGGMDQIPPSSRLRSHRINMKDLIFMCENDPFLCKSNNLYKLHVSSGWQGK